MTPYEQNKVAQFLLEYQKLVVRHDLEFYASGDGQVYVRTVHATEKFQTTISLPDLEVPY